jgi:hypothetical protein
MTRTSRAVDAVTGRIALIGWMAGPTDFDATNAASVSRMARLVLAILAVLVLLGVLAVIEIGVLAVLTVMSSTTNHGGG